MNPPSTNFDQPGDLVIDAFGTFLGKRSERMTVRWREPKEAKPATTAGPVDEPTVLRFPTERIAGWSVEPPQGDDAASVAAQKLVALQPGRDATDRPADAPPDKSEKTHRQSRLAERLADIAEPTDELSRGSVESAWQERQVPFSRLRSVTVCGRGVTVSSDLIEALIERGVQLSFLTSQGEPVASLHAPALGATVQTRRAQLAAYDTLRGFELARAFVQGKLRNQRHTLLYFAKYLKEADQARHQSVLKKADAIRNLRRQVKDVPLEPVRLTRLRDQLMGFEGAGGRLYWEGVAIIVGGKMEFTGRITRGATDPLNSALNYGYGILYSNVFGAVANAGLEPFAGFLHVDRPGKPSLVLDLVEEFRAPVVDRPVIAWVNQGGALDRDEHGLTTKVRRSLADRVLERLNTPVPFAGKRYLLRMVIQIQARSLAAAVREERVYKPYASRW